VSDAIQALNEVVFKAGQRGKIDDASTAVEQADELHILLTEIAVIAGDALEDHVKATNRAKPRKERVYREIVRQIAAVFKDDPLSTDEGIIFASDAVQEILDAYGVSE